MSVVQNPITGRSRGKYSSSIFSKWKGLNTLRSKPLTVNQPNTQSQIDQRSAFATAVMFARQILTMIRYSLKYSAINITEFNQFIRLVIHYVDTVTGKISAGDEDLLSFSAGPEPGLEDAAVVYVSGANFTLSWDDSFMSDLRAATDKMVVFLYNSTQNKMIAIDTAVLFSTGTASVAHQGVAGDVIFVYACVCTVSYARFSPSQYVSTFTVS